MLLFRKTLDSGTLCLLAFFQTLLICNSSNSNVLINFSSSLSRHLRYIIIRHIKTTTFGWAKARRNKSTSERLALLKICLVSIKYKIKIQNDKIQMRTNSVKPIIIFECRYLKISNNCRDTFSNIFCRAICQ